MTNSCNLRSIFLLLLFFSLVLVQHVSLGVDVDEYPEEYPDDTHLPEIATKMVTLGRTVQVYVPKEYFSYKKPEGHTLKQVGNIVNVKDTKYLQGLHAWLYNHDEYKSDPHYIQGRLMQDYHVYTQNINDAMLCYPRCKFGQQEETHIDRKGVNRTFYFDRDYRQIVRFEVNPKYRSKFRGCEFIGFFIEPADMQNDNWDSDYKDPRCITMAPYVHSVYYPHPKPGHKPWNIHPDRDILLTYFGSARKGRKSVLDGIYRALSKPRDFKIVADKTIKYPFVSPDKKTRDNEDNTRWAGEGHMKDRASSAFMIEAWELYVNSIFSWQPEGDTPTRRAFYDSWMFGCIPVISSSVAKVYKELYKGLAFQDIPLEECVVVVDDAIHDDGEKLIKYVAAITHEEVETKRRNMRELAPIMQWGWGGNNGDALHMVFASLMADEWSFVPTAAPTRHNHGGPMVPSAPALAGTNAITNTQAKTKSATASTMASVRESGKSKNYWHQGKAVHKNSVFTGED